MDQARFGLDAAGATGLNSPPGAVLGEECHSPYWAGWVYRPRQYGKRLSKRQDRAHRKLQLNNRKMEARRAAGLLIDRLRAELFPDE